MYKTKKEALDSIRRRVRKVGGKNYTIYECYVGKNPLTKNPQRFYDADRVRLVETVKGFYHRFEGLGDLGTLLSPSQIIDAQSALSVLSKANLDRLTLTECAQLAAETARKNAEVPTKKLGEAYDEYYKTFSDIQVSHKASVRHRVGKWVDTTGRSRAVSSVTGAEIVAWLDEQYPNSNKSWNNAMTYVKTFIEWCRNSLRRYVLANPIEELKKKPVAWKEPEFVRPDVTKKLFALMRADTLAHPDVLAYAVLSFFCGVRREEIIRMAQDPGCVCLEDETVRVNKPKGYQRGIKARAFRAPANALEWMRSFDFAYGLSQVSTHSSERMNDMAKAAKLDVVKNPGRHTFITMHVAAYQDPARTDAMTGTSAQMRANHYMGLASHREGLAHFAITPSNTPAATSATPPTA